MMKFRNYNCEFYIRIRNDEDFIYLIMEKQEEKMEIPLKDVTDKHLSEILTEPRVKSLNYIFEKILDEKKKRR